MAVFLLYGATVKCLLSPGAPPTYFNDRTGGGGGGGPSDFFGSEILAKSDFFGSMKDATGCCPYYRASI